MIIKQTDIAERKRKLRLIAALARNDFRSKYSSSQLGVFWAFFRPVVMSTVYIFVFSLIARSSPAANGYPFAFWLLPGLIAWFAFSDAVSTGTTALTDYSFLVKNIKFDVTLLPTIKTVSSFFVHIFFVALVIILYVIAGLPLKWQMLQLVYYMLALFCLAESIARITSSVQPFFRDMNVLMEIVLLVGMWASPVMWDMGMIPARFQTLLKLNPMYHIVTGYRDSFMGISWFWEHPRQILAFWLTTGVLHFGGKWLFGRLSEYFADVI